MNVVPGVTGPRIACKNYADDTFFHLDLVTDFEPGFVRMAHHGSMWWRLLHPTHRAAPGAVSDDLPEA
jgi:hypothetical protein